MVEIPIKQRTTRLCLARHGETEWNAASRIQGQIDIALNDTGLKQAKAAGRWLKSHGATAIYSSDLKRAWATAECIGAALGLTPQALPNLRERSYGIFQGLTYDEARARHPAAYAAFARRDPDYTFETGESLNQLFARVVSALQTLATAHAGKTIIAVVHGGILDIANRFVRGISLETPRDFPLPNAGLNWISRGDGQWRIDSWGETSHLQAGMLDELPDPRVF